MVSDRDFLIGQRVKIQMQLALAQQQKEFTCMHAELFVNDLPVS